MEGFGVLELLKTLLEKPSQGTEEKAAPAASEPSETPPPTPQAAEPSEGVNSFVAFASAHDARVKKVKK